jgi:uncharacterized membrane protein
MMITNLQENCINSDCNGIFFVLPKNMEKRILGIVLSVLGILGLILAAIKFLNGGGGTHLVKEIITYGILGIIFFTAGIGLIRATRDKPS